MRSYHAQRSRGMTLIEAVFVIGIISILATITLVAFSHQNATQSLKGVSRTAAAILNDARARTLASRNDTQYGVRFESDRIILFAGSSYDEDDPNNEVTTLPSSISMSGISFQGGGSETVFARLTGAPDAHGTITFAAQAEGSPTRTVTLTETGLAYDE